MLDALKHLESQSPPDAREFATLATPVTPQMPDDASGTTTGPYDVSLLERLAATLLPEMRESPTPGAQAPNSEKAASAETSAPASPNGASPTNASASNSNATPTERNNDGSLQALFSKPSVVTAPTWPARTSGRQDSPRHAKAQTASSEASDGAATSPPQENSPSPGAEKRAEQSLDFPCAPTTETPPNILEEVVTDAVESQPTAAAPRSNLFEQQLLQRLDEPATSNCYRRLADQLAGHSQDQTTCLLLANAEGAADFASPIAHLAALLAKEGAAVLLVDVDLRQRSLSRLFQATEAPGLSDLLEDEPASSGVILPTAIDGLSILPAGRETLSAASRSDRLAPLIQAWRRQFRILLPVIGSLELPLAQAFARHADLAFLGVRLGATTDSAARKALSELAQLGVRTVGCVALAAE